MMRLFFRPHTTLRLVLLICLILVAAVGYVQPAHAASFTVNSTGDGVDANIGNGVCATSGGVCTLRAAIQEANAAAGADTITINPVGMITLQSLLPDLATPMTINGPGTVQLTIQKDGGVGSGSLFSVVEGVTVSLNQMTLMGGTAQYGGAIYNLGTLNLANVVLDSHGASLGGAIYNDGTLSIANSLMQNNLGTLGGAIYNDGTLTISDTSVLDNHVSNHGGGLFSVSGTSVTITGSTFSGNRALISGGAIQSGGTLTLINTTFSGNTADDDGGGLYITDGTVNAYHVTLANNRADNNNAGADDGGGIFRYGGTIMLANTLLYANRVAGGVSENCSGSVVNGGGSMSTDSTCAGFASATTAQVNLGALANNNGPTYTHALLPGSVAINAGNNALIPSGLTTDQRGAGYPRVVGAAVDVGAFELQTLPLVYNPVVNVTTNDPDTNLNDGVCDSSAAAGNQCSLRAALDNANADPNADTITFDPAVFSTAQEISTGGFLLTNTVTIDGPGAHLLTIDGGSTFFISTGAVATIEGLTIANVTQEAIESYGTLTLTQSVIGGDALNPMQARGIRTWGMLTVNNSTFHYINGDGIVGYTNAPINVNNSVFDSVNGISIGGSNVTVTGSRFINGTWAIFNEGTLAVADSVFSNNIHYRDGMGITNNGTTTVRNSAFISNQASSGGAIENSGSMTVINSTFSGNTADNRGGAIHNAFGDLTIINSTFSSNSASSGSDIHLSAGTVTVHNSILSSSGSGGSCYNYTGTFTFASSLSTDASCGATGIAQVTSAQLNLGPLADNGGLSQTHALLPGSVAINAGDNALVPSGITTDQRGSGFNRVFGSAVDIGAFESQSLPAVTLTASDTNAAEAGTENGVYTISRDTSVGSLNVNLTIDAGSSASPSDYTLTGGTVNGNTIVVTIPDGATSADLTLTPVNDALDESSESLTLLLLGGAYSIGNPTTASITIADDDSTGITITPTSGLITTEAGGTAQFVVTLHSQPTADVAILLTSSDASEGIVASSVTLTSANWQTGATVTVSGVDDTLMDGDIAYTIITDGISTTDNTYRWINPTTVPDISVTNKDNDTYGFIIEPLSGLTTTEAGGTAQFTVRLATKPTASVVLALRTSDTSEGLVPASVGLNTLNWNTGVTVTITGRDDAVKDGDIAYSIITGAVTSTDPNYSGLDPLTIPDVSVTNTDDEGAPGIIITPTSGLVTTEGGGTAQFNVRLATQPSANLTLALSSSDTTEGTVPIGVTITTANWSTGVNVTVTGKDDALNDGDIAYTIITGAVTSADPNYSGLNPAEIADVSVTNTDNEGAGFIITPTSGLVTTEAGGTATFTIKLASQPTANVTLTLSSSDTSEGSVRLSLIFTPGTWNVARTVTVTGVNDFIADGDIAYTIITGAVTSDDPNYSSLNPANIPDVSVTNTDDEAGAGVVITPTGGLVTSEAGGTATFNVRLTTQPTASVTVALSSNDTTEGTVPAGVTITTANWNTGVNVTVTGKDDVLDDGDIAYTIITGAVTSSDPLYSAITAGSIADVAVTNTDNDGAGFVIEPTSGLVTTEAGGTATFNIRLTSRPSANVTIAFSSSDTTEGTVRTSLTFTPDTWNLARTVIVTGVNDALADGNIAYSIITGMVTSADTSYSSLDPASIPDIGVTNTDDETSGSAAVVTSISPVGTLAQTPVTFTWVGNASSYRLNILQEVAVDGELQTFALLKNSYEANVICENGMCSAQPDIPLTPGVTYVWIVEAVGADGQVIGSAALSFTMPSVMVAPSAPELPELPPTDSNLLPPVTLVSPVRETSENPVAFTWIGAADAVEYRLLVQNQTDRSAVVDVVVGAESCNGNVCVSIPVFVPQSGVSYVWTVTPISASGAGTPSAEASFSYNAAAPGDGIELPGTIIGG